MKNNDHGYGWKFLDPSGCTHYGGTETIYPLPRNGETWGPWMSHPSPATPDGHDCGPGRYHVMRHLSAKYAPCHWWPWICEYRGVVGESNEKISATFVRIRRISRQTWHRMLRGGAGSHTDLSYAHLRGSDLRYADLSGSDLSGSDLRGSDLRYADLSGADLSGSDLRYADLSGAKGYNQS